MIIPSPPFTRLCFAAPTLLRFLSIRSNLLCSLTFSLLSAFKEAADPSGPSADSATRRSLALAGLRSQFEGSRARSDRQELRNRPRSECANEPSAPLANSLCGRKRLRCEIFNRALGKLLKAITGSLQPVSAEEPRTSRGFTVCSSEAAADAHGAK